MKIYLSMGLIGISILIILIYSFRKNNNFIDMSNIFKDHFKIFNNSYFHIAIIYILPLIMAIGITLIYTLDSKIIDSIFVILSIIISALISFEGLIMNIDIRNKTEQYKEILLETNSSINFTILINILLIFMALIYNIIPNEYVLIKSGLSAIIIYLLIVTFLTILIISKRIRVLLKLNIK